MRKSIISSLVATVVAIANDRLVAAGVVAGAGLRRNSMREHLGNWHEPMLSLLESCYQASYTCGGTQDRTRDHQVPSHQIRSRRLPVLNGDMLNAVMQMWQMSGKRSMQHAFAFSPAYAASARVAPKG